MKIPAVLVTILLVLALLLGCAPKSEPPVTPSSTPTPASEETLPQTPPSESTPTPAEFTISSLSVTPSEVKPGQQVRISAVVTNTGGSEGSYAVILKINDVEETRKQIAIEAGKNETIDFSVVRDKVGSYKVSIDDKVGQFSVSVPTTTYTPPPTSPTPTPTPSWREVSSPSNINVPGAQWIEVDALGGKKILAAVFTPQGTGPFPVVMFLHGTGGFQLSDVEMARDLAKFGFIGVAAGWFGGHYTGIEVVTPIASWPEAINWSNGPDILGPGDSTAIIERIGSLVSAMRTLPKARTDRFGLIGHSRGSTVSITTAAAGVDVQAIVALAGYPQNAVASWLRAPVLILHGTADQTVSVEKARSFESTLRSLNKTVESHYYEGATHYFPQTSPWREDMIQRAGAFFNKYILP